MLKNSHVCIIIWLFGFISGFNIMITGNTLNYWFAKKDIALQTIGILSFITLPYSINFLLAPVFDTVQIKCLNKILGHRLSWICLTSTTLISLTSILSFLDPGTDLVLLSFIAFIISFFSATQDTILSALRTEIVPKELLGFTSGIYIFGYRVGMLLASSGAIYLSIYLTFNKIYQIFACVIFVYLILLILVSRYTNSVDVIEENTSYFYVARCYTMEEMHLKNEFFIKHYFNFFKNCISAYLLKIFSGSHVYRNDISLAYFIVLILIFLVLYRLPDNLINVMINPFLLHLGYNAFEIASVCKFCGVIGAIIGGLIGGIIMKYKNMLYSILLFGIIHALSHILFILLEVNGKNSLILFITIGIESITGGMTMTAYIAFISSLCQGKFRATQYSLLSSMMGISRSIFPIISGYMVVNFGWQNFFLFTTIITIPSLLILLKIQTKL
ncbi:AmpG family muropeptide MFS transporter [Rickettsia typhi]|uniref:Putative transporter AmpG 1 n=2 Tax=Rickettsia typhi TaxID=785 RepID=AMPG1_RICTY|nr:AmpG family muropeptide MFS transporter [Rickettsia typhi]Q68WQ5.1 RecName: Full=Putative transporter AmpG 1 [Rickettsia typhi str. Wilmington]AAU03937.1 murein peptide permease protein AmpG [Rickettsia typhi str. Wilmington]AFE54318.1 murein peptide permease protein AmpG [Rickettsia typhi str. TH1527]AFE55158.1 murein peptide permease protein AmpG [Rickettsia typhi str. B9991CWPP]